MWTTCTDCGDHYAVNESGREALGRCEICQQEWDDYRNQTLRGEEAHMYNTCTLVGCVGDEGVATVEKRNGTRMTGFRLALQNTRRDGQRYTTVVDIEAYGVAIAQAEQLAPGAVVLVEGKVTPRRGTTGDASLAIVARQIQMLPAETARFLDAREVDREDH